MRRSFIVLVLFTFLPVLFWACVSIKDVLKEPKVSLDGIDVSEANAKGATLVFKLLVENPNSLAVTVDRLKYDLELNGKAFTSGRIDQETKIPANDKTTVSVPVPVQYAAVFSSLLELMKNGGTQFRFKGEAGVGPFTVPFDKAGEVKLAKVLE